MSHPKLFIVLFFSLIPLTIGATSSQKSLAPHIHGEGQIDLAANGGQLMMSLIIPSATLMGYEHQAQSDSEKAKLKQTENILTHPIPNIFNLVPENKCQVDGPVAIENVMAEGHAEFRLEIQLKCLKKLEKSKLRFNIFSTFKQLKKISVNLIRANGEINQLTFDKNQEILL